MIDLSLVSTDDLHKELNNRFEYELNDLEIAKKIVSNFHLAIKIEEWAG